MSIYNNVIEYTDHKPVEPEKPVNPGNNQGDNNNTQPNVPTPSNNGGNTNASSDYYVANGNLVWNGDGNGLLIVAKSKTDD